MAAMMVMRQRPDPITRAGQEAIDGGAIRPTSDRPERGHRPSSQVVDITVQHGEAAGAPRQGISVYPRNHGDTI